MRQIVSKIINFVGTQFVCYCGGIYQAIIFESSITNFSGLSTTIAGNIAFVDL
jgi:hypothetical protein